MIRHCVLLSLQKGFLTGEVIVKTKEIYRKIIESDDAFLGCSVYENCIDRQGNYDVMIELWLDDALFLNRYLESEGHQRFVAFIGPHVLGKVSFDHTVESSPRGNVFISEGDC